MKRILVLAALLASASLAVAAPATIDTGQFLSGAQETHFHPVAGNYLGNCACASCSLQANSRELTPTISADSTVVRLQVGTHEQMSMPADAIFSVINFGNRNAASKKAEAPKIPTAFAWA